MECELHFGMISAAWVIVFSITLGYLFICNFKRFGDRIAFALLLIWLVLAVPDLCA